MKQNILKTLVLFLVCGILVVLAGCSGETHTPDPDRSIEAGEFYLEYGEYKNIDYSDEQDPMNGSYTLEKDGTFAYTNVQGTATGTYTVFQGNYTNSAETKTGWLICFRSSNTEILNANQDWLVSGQNQFSGIQDGGTFRRS